ncbi:bifunctional sugar phosphate isomerase/epimerase/4-hydroxyphenylpyruvate dioxygenase family protein [Kocuria rhizophila]|uniref:bifunctional sugar phosphate isomerase/epimerase/4-hydroxyphenylpyruvate dioxygenase family protein n=1 Tax=Kocuria rhizophila TaxID=72000 RepID=UPI00190C5106|nr:sugar phosphate isomerase/epimerase and 4-hydroxyphenylpyruvate domain-containing protein [Kocuria rhizophila]MBK4120489.1 sugar phosphate isomerase/epimerase and 4-hydroxyphenylpyruvate domain-containing protein [Kocuria rhizophila]
MAAAAGFDGIEVFEPDLVVSPSSPEQIRELATGLGLSLDLYQPFRDGVEVAPEALPDSLRRLRAKCELMNRLGTTVLLVCSNVATAVLDDDRAIAEQLRAAGDIADEYGIDLAYEALAWGAHVNDWRRAHRIVELADHPRVGTCLDSFHILSRGDDVTGVETLDPRRIFFVQLADAPLLQQDVLSWSRHPRVFPGEGDFDLVDLLRRLHECGYAGPVSLEIFNDSFRQADVHRTAVDGLRSLRWLEDRTADVVRDAGGYPGRPPLELTDLPSPQPPRSWDFLELRTRELGRVTRLLHQLGFALAGHHRSKDTVQAWVQGPVRIVVSEDPRATEQPTRLAALGFQVADPDVAAQRAERLLAPAVDRPQRPDETVLHGVVAPDGTEIFFGPHGPDGVPPWLGEFGADPEGAASSALILGVDHVNLAQPWQHYDEAVLFLTSLLDLHPTTAQEVAGPSGLVRSQVMRSEGDTMRIPLNVAPMAAEQGAFTGAAYPEHIALACSDIVAVARRARRRGMQFLPVPQNYYEDLVARMDLSEEFVEELRDHGLLYDRDEHGEFLHFYTATLGEVFVEVVERRGGYRGFGAPNAPVRLAAQYREFAG